MPNVFAGKIPDAFSNVGFERESRKDDIIATAFDERGNEFVCRFSPETKVVHHVLVREHANKECLRLTADAEKKVSQMLIREFMEPKKRAFKTTIGVGRAEAALIGFAGLSKANRICEAA